MKTTAFFDESTEQSRIKAAIVSDYFWAWAKVIISSLKKQRGGRVAYIDLFAGPGRYTDGTRSTPLMVLERAISDADMREYLVAQFNDADKANASMLQEEINALPGIEKLKHKPQVASEEVGDKIVKMFERMNLVPTFFLSIRGATRDCHSPL